MKTIFKQGNYVVGAALFALAVLLSWWGVMAISSPQHLLPAMYKFAGRQQIFILTGVASMLLAAAIPFRYYCKYAWHLTILAVLSLVLLSFYGRRINGMQGWYDLGICYFQPSEIFKGVFLLGISLVLCNEFLGGKRFWVFLLLLGAWAAGIARQPDFGTLAVYLAAGIAVYYITEGEWKYLVFSGMALAAGALAVIKFYPYVGRRIAAFFSPESGYFGDGWQLRQFEMAIAEGGNFGAKAGKTLWSSRYLPLAHNDSVMAAMAETSGMLGIIVYSSLSIALLWCIFSLGGATRSAAAKTFIFGVLLLLALQGLLHMSVNAGLFPVTGVTLPFVSYGGSSLIGCFLLLGMVLSASRSN